MLYVKNNIKFAVAFTVEKDGRSKRFEFDCRRVYKDTGNVVTTGVTPIDDADFDYLYKNSKQFKDHVDSGLLEKTKESGATSMANTMDALAKENEVLKKKLAEKTKEASTATNEELEATKAENETLKKKLEALSKPKASKAKTELIDDSEGF